MRQTVQKATETGLAGWLERIVLVDFAVFFLFVFDRYTLPIGMPGGVALATLVAFIAAIRRPILKVPHLGWYVTAYAGILGYLILVAEINDISWPQRILRFTLIGFVAWSLAEGRIDRFSALAGMGSALVLNVGMYYAGLTSDNYPPYLTGFFGDKNVAGLWYSVVGLLGISLFKRLRYRLIWVMIMGGFVYLTGSRTSIAAFLVGLAWYHLRQYIGPVLSAVFAFVSMRLLLFFEEDFSRIGVFADRDGTDWFREQIKIATQAKVEAAPWYGKGVGEATVTLGPFRSQFFHSSYDTLRIEGGWPFAIVWIAALVILFVGVLSTKKVTRDMRAAEGAIVAVMVCAWQLGEVFFTSIAFIAMGFALNARYAVPRTKKDEFYL